MFSYCKPIVMAQHGLAFTRTCPCSCLTTAVSSLLVVLAALQTAAPVAWSHMFLSNHWKSKCSDWTHRNKSRQSGFVLSTAVLDLDFKIYYYFRQK